MADAPFFQRRQRTGDKKSDEKKPRTPLWRRPWFWRLCGGLVGLVTLVGVSVGVYQVFWLGALTIDFVDVEHDDGVDATRVRGIVFNQMEQSRFGILPQRILPFFDEEAAQGKIWEEYALDLLLVEKRYPRTLKITIKGTPFMIAWLGEGDQWYHLDAKGRAARAVDSKSLAPVAAKLSSTDRFAELIADKDKTKDAMPLVLDTERKAVSINDVITAPEKVSFVVSLPEKLKAIGITPLYYKTSRGSADIRAVTTEGWEILFNPRGDAEAQVRYLDVVLRDKVKTDRPRLKYVDVRFDNRIYFKL